MIANVGNSLEWINPADCFTFWKNEAQQHIADNLEHIELEKFPGEYAYIASRWSDVNNVPVILLEKAH
ncbi:MAG: hypothetical protein WCF67_25260 [Chitinophagaceae bacterium]